MIDNIKYFHKIICLTEESVELLFALGCGDKIIGRSAFVKRPREALKIPVMSQFTKSNISKIIAAKPDLVLGFSDIQKDIARELIGAGLNVFISNQRSLSEILQNILSLSSMIGVAVEGQSYVSFLQATLAEISNEAQNLKKRPRIYFEEWDDPMISAIKWVGELIEICGGVNIFPEYSQGSLASQRMPKSDDVVEANPDIIFVCWCGKKMKKETIRERKNWGEINAVKNDLIIELEPEIFLQPGIAPIIDGSRILLEIFKKWSQEQEDL